MRGVGTRRRQRGVAVVTAILIATLVTILVAQWFAAQDALGRTIEVQRNGTQARWLLTAATDWARLLLREDGNQRVDHLLEVWAVPLAPTRITDESGRLEAWASGRIEDAQARFNLADLATDAGIDGNSIASFQRLYEALGLPEGQLMPVVQAVARTLPADRSIVNGTFPMPQIKTALDLQGMKGIEDATLVQLAPYTTVYPRSAELVKASPNDKPVTKMSPININTAAAPVIASINAVFSGGLAQAVVSKRERLTFFKDLGDFQTQVAQITAAQPDGSRPVEFSFRTDFFIARGRLQLGRVDIAREAMLRRPQGNAAQTEVIWVRDL